MPLAALPRRAGTPLAALLRKRFRVRVRVRVTVGLGFGLGFGLGLGFGRLVEEGVHGPRG